VRDLALIALGTLAGYLATFLAILLLFSFGS